MLNKGGADASSVRHESLPRESATGLGRGGFELISKPNLIS